MVVKITAIIAIMAIIDKLFVLFLSSLVLFEYFIIHQITILFEDWIFHHLIIMIVMVVEVVVIAFRIHWIGINFTNL